MNNPSRARGQGRLIRVGLALALAFGLAGWIGGRLANRWRERRFVQNVRETLWSIRPADTGEALAALPELRARRRELPRSLPARLAMARLLSWLAQDAPDRRPYRQAALAELDSRLAAAEWPDLSAAFRRDWTRTRALLLMDLGNEAAAREALAELEAPAAPEAGGAARTAEERVLDRNNLAYLLATAASPEVRRPREALALAKEAAARRLPLPDAAARRWSATVLDTLAAAYLAGGETESAAIAQTSALGLAGADSLYDILRQYDRITERIMECITGNDPAGAAAEGFGVEN